MAQSIAVYSIKGGVGKTTLAVNLAFCAAANAARRVLLWDIDAQGAATYLCAGKHPVEEARCVFAREIEPTKLTEPTRWPRLDVLAADMSLRNLDHLLSDAEKPKRLRKLLEKLGSKYDKVILDCPPGLGEMSEQLFRAADLIVVPVLPTPIGLRSLAQVQDHIERNHKRRPALLPVISMVDQRKKLHREFLADNPGWPVIPQASVIERMVVERSPVMNYAGKSPGAQAIGNLWSRIDGLLSTMAKSHVDASAKYLPNHQATPV